MDIRTFGELCALADHIMENYPEDLMPFDKAFDLAIRTRRIAIEQERNDILAKAFCVQETGHLHPSALEAIAMQLGYTEHGQGNMMDAIYSLSDYEMKRDPEK